MRRNDFFKQFPKAVAIGRKYWKQGEKFENIYSLVNIHKANSDHVYSIYTYILCILHLVHINTVELFQEKLGKYRGMFNDCVNYTSLCC